ncbi:MAG: ribosome silencing factor [candidate division Zixibacteria bacterium]|nr:ribosome silencing factor [candidate division Zixibacteria bacterium]
MAQAIGKLALSKKAVDVRILNLKKISDVTDYFVICSGDVSPHVKAISDNVKDGLKKKGIRPWHTEGYGNTNWVILDFVNVVLHIFTREARDFYNLEDLWGDAPTDLLGDG